MLVKESLYNFKRDTDPIQSSGLGLRSTISMWLNKYEIENYIINHDFSINVKDDVDLSSKGLTKLPEYINFNVINGSFFINNNFLKIMRGFPKIVTKDFNCSVNNLTSLEHCPITIGKNFNCFTNFITSLEGCPTKINGSFSCSNNKLVSLDGCHSYVGKDFFCIKNKVKFSEKYVRSYCEVKGEIKC